MDYKKLTVNCIFYLNPFFFFFVYLSVCRLASYCSCNVRKSGAPTRKMVLFCLWREPLQILYFAGGGLLQRTRPEAYETCWSCTSCRMWHNLQNLHRNPGSLRSPRTCFAHGYRHLCCNHRRTLDLFTACCQIKLAVSSHRLQFPPLRTGTSCSLIA